MTDSTVMIREGVRRIVREHGYWLSETWDGVSEDVPVGYPLANPWVSGSNTAKLSSIRAIWEKANRVHPCG